MRAFRSGWNLLKMPFVPGSIRVEGVDEADDEYEERTRYEADFFDPVDSKTRRLRLHPLPRRKPRPEGAPRRLFGGGPPQEGIITSIELPDEDTGEPEMMFGREQQEPFAFFAERGYDRGMFADRLFVPSHLRGSERGIADALLDATVELRQNLGRDARITPDLLQTKDAIRFFHDRTGNSPRAVYPMSEGSTVGDDDYYRAEYGSYETGSHPNDPPEWNTRGNRGKETFDEAWQRMFTRGQLDLQEREETSRYYDRARDCTACGGNIEAGDCVHGMGHPYFEDFVPLEEMHPNTRKEHEQMKSLYPATWALREMQEAER